MRITIRFGCKHEMNFLLLVIHPVATYRCWTLSTGIICWCIICTKTRVQLSSGCVGKLYGVRLERNLAENGNGGGVECIGAQLFHLRDSSIRSNEARMGYGGGISTTGTEELLLETTKSLKCCEISGAGFHCTSEQAGCQSTVIQNNTALTSSGGGLYASSTKVLVRGVPADVDPETGRVVESSNKAMRHHVAVVRNNAQVGGGFFLTGSSTASLDKAWIKSN